MSDRLRGETKETKLKKSSLLVGAGLAIAVLLLVAAVFFLLKSSNVVEPVALKVGDREVTVKQFDSYVSAGKNTATSKQDVTSIVTEYEKRQIMAEKYSLDIPKEYIALSREDMIADSAFGENGGSIDTLRTADDELTKLRLYNSAFDTFVLQAGDGGKAILLYDIPIVASLDDAASVQKAKNSAEKLRSQLEDGSIDGVSAIKKAQQLNIGQPAQSGLYFIRTSDGAVLSRYGGGVYTRLLEPALIQKAIQGLDSGITEVKQYEQLSVYFVKVLDVVEASKDLEAKVETDMSKIKVVNYVK